MLQLSVKYHKTKKNTAQFSPSVFCPHICLQWDKTAFAHTCIEKKPFPHTAAGFMSCETSGRIFSETQWPHFFFLACYYSVSGLWLLLPNLHEKRLREVVMMRLEREGDTSAQLLKFVRGSKDDESDLAHKVWRQHRVLDLSRFLGKAHDHMLHVSRLTITTLGRFKFCSLGIQRGDVQVRGRQEDFWKSPSKTKSIENIKCHTWLKAPLGKNNSSPIMIEWQKCFHGTIFSADSSSGQEGIPSMGTQGTQRRLASTYFFS